MVSLWQMKIIFFISIQQKEETMKTHTFANVIIQDLSSAAPLHDGFENSSNIISQIVDNWDKNIYTIPRKALQIHHEESQKYLSM